MRKCESLFEACGSRILSALDDCPKSGLSDFYETVGAIRARCDNAVGVEFIQVQSWLDSVIETLQVTNDANGEKILGMRRWEKFMKSE
jgi:hypothetical protein